MKARPLPPYQRSAALCRTAYTAQPASIFRSNAICDLLTDPTAHRQQSVTPQRRSDRAHGLAVHRVLPGAHSLLEQFKVAYRKLDVRNAAIENATLKLECLCSAGRLLAGEFEDPETKRKIQINSAVPAIFVPPEA